jgi:hypothetical protein
MALCPASARLAPRSSLREASSFLPRGWRCSLAALATPTRATRQRFPACGPSASVRDSRAVSPRQQARRGPARFGVMAPPTPGADFAPTLLFSSNTLERFWHRVTYAVATVSLAKGRGVEIAGAAGGKSLRSPRAPDALAASGRRRRSITRTPRGPGADRAVRSRAQGCAAAERGGAQGRTQPPAGPAKQKLHSIKKKNDDRR